MRIFNSQSDIIVLENKYMRREIAFRLGKPITSKLTRLDSGFEWNTGELDCILRLPVISWDNCQTSYDKENRTVIFVSNGWTVRWVFDVAENLPAIRSQLFFKCDGKAENIDDESIISDTVGHSGTHLALETVSFFDKSDRTDSLVRKSDSLLYGASEDYFGNLFVATDRFAGECCAILKESPVSESHLYRKGADLQASYARLSICGAGVDLSNPEQGFMQGYPVVLMVCRDGDASRVVRQWNYESGNRAEPIMMSNTWGDRSKGEKLSEDFIRSEILRAEQIGVEVVQIDAGWQQDGGSDVQSETYKDNTDYWMPNAEKFPNGFAPLCKFAEEHHTSIGLWFNPDGTDEYANWEKDASVLLGFYNSCGIRHFKIDGVDLGSKTAEINFLSMCRRVLNESDNRISLQLDITNDRRLGYFYEKTLGSLFVENRYTDWRNYYPYRTLRNLWQLSEYMPAAHLQMELLNPKRNADKYCDDVFAPINYPIDYLFASVMVSSPLFWMELTGLTEEDTEKLSAIAGVYKKYRDDFKCVIPTGSCPDGLCVTGFKIIGDKHNYFIGLRDLGDENSVKINAVKILATNDEGLTYDGGQISFSGCRKYVFAIISD